MDTPHAGLTLRPWLLGMGISEVVLMLLSITIPIIYIWGVEPGKVSLRCWGTYGPVINWMWILKYLTWTVVELLLFINGISKYCHGKVYAYGLALLIFHGLLIVLLIGFLYLIFKSWSKVFFFMIKINFNLVTYQTILKPLKVFLSTSQLFSSQSQDIFSLANCISSYFIISYTKMNRGNIPCPRCKA